MSFTAHGCTPQELHASGLLFSFAVDEAHCVTSWGVYQTTLQCLQFFACTAAAWAYYNWTSYSAGHDFRPAYLHLAKLRKTFPGVAFAALVGSPRHCPPAKHKHGLCVRRCDGGPSPPTCVRIPTLYHACMQTATATPEVRSAIVEALALQSPVMFNASFNRPNIQYAAQYQSTAARCTNNASGLHAAISDSLQSTDSGISDPRVMLLQWS